MKPPLPPRFEVTDDGERISVTVDCGPMTQPHVFELAPEVVRDAWLASQRAKYGADAFGRL